VEWKGVFFFPQGTIFFCYPVSIFTLYLCNNLGMLVVEMLWGVPKCRRGN